MAAVAESEPLSWLATVEAVTADLSPLDALAYKLLACREASRDLLQSIGIYDKKFPDPTISANGNKHCRAETFTGWRQVEPISDPAACARLFEIEHTEYAKRCLVPALCGRLALRKLPQATISHFLIETGKADFGKKVINVGQRLWLHERSDLNFCPALEPFVPGYDRVTTHYARQLEAIGSRVFGFTFPLPRPEAL